MKKVNILIPCAGRGQRFKDAGYIEDKPLIRVNNTPMITRVIRNLRTKRRDCRFIFVYTSELAEKIRPVLRAEDPESVCISIDGTTRGSACTALLASEEINNSDPLVIASCDQLADFSLDLMIEDAETRSLHGSLLTFPSERPHCSFVKLGKYDLATEVAEKKVISNHANVGIYYFVRGDIFVESAKKMIEKEITYNNEYYIAPVYNQMIEDSMGVGIYEISKEDTHLLGTPEELETYMKEKYGHIPEKSN